MSEWSAIEPDLTSYRLQPSGGYVAVISRGRIRGSSGAILSPEGKLFFDLSQEYDPEQHRMLEVEEHPVFHKWSDLELQYLKGTTAALIFCGNHNYFHWMYDVLPRLAMLDSSGMSYSSIMMNSHYPPWATNTLRKFLLPHRDTSDYYMLYAQGKSDPAIKFAGLEDIRVDIDRLQQTLNLIGLTK